MLPGPWSMPPTRSCPALATPLPSIHTLQHGDLGGGRWREYSVSSEYTVSVLAMTCVATDKFGDPPCGLVVYIQGESHRLASTLFLPLLLHRANEPPSTACSRRVQNTCALHTASFILFSLCCWIMVSRLLPLLSLSLTLSFLPPPPLAPHLPFFSPFVLP